MSSIRFRVDPGDVPADKAARRLHLTLDQFLEKLPRLLARGFPAADPDTGNFDLDAIDLWRRQRHVKLSEVAPTMGDRFVAVHEQRLQNRTSKKPRRWKDGG